jgi:hypothetical protein
MVTAQMTRGSDGLRCIISGWDRVDPGSRAGIGVTPVKALNKRHTTHHYIPHLKLRGSKRQAYRKLFEILDKSGKYNAKDWHKVYSGNGFIEMRFKNYRLKKINKLRIIHSNNTIQTFCNGVVRRNILKIVQEIWPQPVKTPVTKSSVKALVDCCKTPVKYRVANILESAERSIDGQPVLLVIKGLRRREIAIVLDVKTEKEIPIYSKNGIESYWRVPIEKGGLIYIYIKDSVTENVILSNAVRIDNGIIVVEVEG